MKIARLVSVLIPRPAQRRYWLWSSIVCGIVVPIACFGAATEAGMFGAWTLALDVVAGVTVLALASWLRFGGESDTWDRIDSGVMLSGAVIGTPLALVLGPLGAITIMAGLMERSWESVALGTLGVAPAVSVAVLFANASAADPSGRQRSGLSGVRALGFFAPLGLGLATLLFVWTLNWRCEADILSEQEERVARAVDIGATLHWTMSWNRLEQAYLKERKSPLSPRTPRADRIAQAYGRITGDEIEGAAFFGD